MKNGLFVIILSFLVSCNSYRSSGGGGASPKIEDSLVKVYNVGTGSPSEIAEKMEFYDNDTVKITKKDGSIETLKTENL